MKKSSWEDDYRIEVPTMTVYETKLKQPIGFVWAKDQTLKEKKGTSTPPRKKQSSR